MARWWVIVFALLCAQVCTIPCEAQQLWTGVLATSNAYPWQGNVGMGANGDTLPESAWTQFGSTIAPIGTSGSPVACTSIVSAASGIGAHQYIKLGAGSFFLSTGCLFQGFNNFEVRGSGPNPANGGTDLVFSGVTGCGHGLGHGVMCLDGNDGTFPGGVSTAFDVTAGLSQGSTSITVSNSTGIVANSTTIHMDQCDDGWTGVPCTGTAVDNGGFFNCQIAYVPLANDPGTITVTGGTSVTGTGFSAAFGSMILVYIGGVGTSIPWTFGSSTTGTLGTSIANGTYQAAFPSGCSFNNSVNAARAHRGQEEAFEVTACNPTPCGQAVSTVLTLSSPIANPNWSTAQSPQIWLVQPSQTVGFRDFKIDTTAITNVNTIQWDMEFDAVWQPFAYNIVIESPANVGIYNFLTDHGLFLSDYIHRSGDDTAQDTSGTNMFTSNTLIENVICHDCHLPFIWDGPGTGNVVAHSYCTNVYTGGADLFNAEWTEHSNGSNYNLWEDVICPSAIGDQAHAAGSLMTTFFRPVMTGWDSCANGQCGSSTAKTDNLVPVMNVSYNRYWHIIDGILGTPGIQNIGYRYQSNSYYFSSGAGKGYIYNTGSGSRASPTLTGTVTTSGTAVTWQSGNEFQPDFFAGATMTIGAGSCTVATVISFTSLTCTTSQGVQGTPVAYSLTGSGNAGGPFPIDPVSLTTQMSWMNYDVFNGSVQANSSEVPSGIAILPTPVPTTVCTPTIPCPASFYQASKPAFWGNTLPWPASGSDITSGTLGIVGGTINTTGHQSGMPAIVGTTYVGDTTATAWGGHANPNPAMNCFLNTLGGLPDGTNGAVAFDATVCFSGSAATSGPTLNGAFKATGTWN